MTLGVWGSQSRLASEYLSTHLCTCDPELFNDADSEHTGPEAGPRHAARVRESRAHPESRKTAKRDQQQGKGGHLRRTFQRMRRSRKQTRSGTATQATRETAQRSVAPHGCERENRTVEWKIPSLGTSSTIPLRVRWSRTRIVSPSGTPADSERTREVGAGRSTLQFHSSLQQKQKQRGACPTRRQNKAATLSTRCTASCVERAIERSIRSPCSRPVHVPRIASTAAFAWHPCPCLLVSPLYDCPGVLAHVGRDVV